MDLEHGGAGYNIHIKVNGQKYYYDMENNCWPSGVPKRVTGNSIINKALAHGFEKNRKWVELMTVTLNNKQNDISLMIAHFYGSQHNIHDTVPTNCLLLLGEANQDLRCVVFSYSWEFSPELRKNSLEEWENFLMEWDGYNKVTEDYMVKTVTQQDIEKAFQFSEETKYILKKYGKTKVAAVELSGSQDDLTAILELN